MILVVDYGLGNLFSVAKAFERLGATVVVSGDHADIKKAERVVLPGVGAFGDGMSYLKERGLDQALGEAILIKKKPFLGICLGLQMLADLGYEYGEHKGLGWIGGEVSKLDVEKADLKVPHIGWNEISVLKDSPLFVGLKPDADFYFLHSFQLVCKNRADLTAIAFYGGEITAAIQHENIFATQFHPEKSQENGLKILGNFIKWNP